MYKPAYNAIPCPASLNGRVRVPFRVKSGIPLSSTVSDILFFLFVVGVPSTFFGLVNPEWIYRPGLFDIRMILILFCCLLSARMIIRWRVLLQLPAGAWLIVAAVYSGLHYVFSAFQFGPGEAFKVFRYFCLPIVAIGPLLYVLSLSRARQLRFLKWGFFVTVLQGLAYILHHAGISIFAAPVHQTIELGGGTVQRFNYAFPPYTLLVLNASLVFVLFQRRFRFGIYFLLSVSVLLLYATRVLIIQGAFNTIMIIAMAMFKSGRKSIGRIGVICLFLIMGCIVFQMIFPQYLGFIAERFSEISGWEGLRGAVSYNKRMTLVEIAVNDMAGMKDMLIGHGYERRPLWDWFQDNYSSGDLSMQGDAPFAGLLYTEGVMGLLLRAAPFLILLSVHIRCFRSSIKVNDTMISTLIIVMIAGTGLTWLQTPALRELPLFLLPYFLLHSFHSFTGWQTV